MFYFRESTNILIILMYEDDIIVTGSNSDLLSSLLSQLSSQFMLKNLGRLSYLIGVQASFSAQG